MTQVPESWELPENPRFIEDYLVLETIGSGAMGEVLKVRQVRTHRMAAIKILRAGVSPDRFRKEIEILGALDHPGIVKVLRDGVLDGQPWFAMDFVDGSSLDLLAAGKPLSTRRVVPLMIDVAEALQYAHDQGVLHRDLKPSNILLDPFGRARLVDFGIGKVLGAAAVLTQTGEQLGTPSYMAPEQVGEGLGGESPRTDVYGLGATMYHLLTGVPPFRGDNLARVLKSVVEQDPASPALLHAGLDRDLETICLKCLRKAPGDRYGSVLEIAEDLRRWLQGRPILARPLSAWERTTKWARREPRVAGAVATTFMALLIGVLGINWQRQRAETRRVEAIAANHQKVIERADDLVESGRTEDAVRLLHQAMSEDPGDSAVAQRLYATLVQHPLPRRLGAIEGSKRWMYATASPIDDRWVLRDVDGASWLALTRNPGSTGLHALFAGSATSTKPRFTPDGSRIFALTEQGHRLWVTEVDRPEHGRVSVLASAGSAVWCSSNGQELLVASDRQVTLFQEEGEGFRQRWTLSLEGVTQAVFGASNATIWVGGDGGVWRLSRVEPSSEGVPRIDSLPITPPLIELCHSIASERLWVWDGNGPRWSEGGDPQGFIPIPWVSRRPLAAQFSATGERLVIVPRGRAFHIIDPESADPLTAVVAHAREISSARMHPSGLWVTTGADDGTVRIWDAHDGSPVSGVVSTGSPVRDAVLSGDGLRLCIVTMQGVAEVWEMPRRPTAVHPTRFPMPADGTQMTADGRWVVMNVPDAESPETASALLWYDIESDQLIRQDLGKRLGGPVVFARRAQTGVGIVADGGLHVFNAPHYAEGFVIPTARTLLALSPDGSRLAVSAPASLEIWSVPKRRSELEIAGLSQMYWAGFSAEGQRLALLDSTGWTMVDFPGGRRWRLTESPSGTPRGVGISRTGRWVAWWRDQQVDLLDVNDGRLTTRTNTSEITTVTFAMGDAVLSIADRAGMVRLWETETFREIGVPMRHGGVVNSVDFHPKQNLLATASSDDSMRLWDSRTGLAMSSPVSSPEVRGVRFSLDGKYLLSDTGARWAIPAVAPGMGRKLLVVAAEALGGGNRSTGHTNLEEPSLRWLTTCRTAADLDPVVPGGALTWGEYRRRRLSAARLESDRTTALREAARSAPSSPVIRERLFGLRWKDGAIAHEP
ncbi:MAG: protein kinase [Verrucomicrobiales bacterium]|nr:protein kinase [Verrucomicrobiales bacterium]